jgi:phytoene dehydrogenase-like protein
MRGFRMRGTTAQVLLALRSQPRFAACPDEAIELARTAANLLAIERAFDAVKYRSIADEPVLEIALPTVASPDRAPEGHAVLSVLVHFAPYDLDPAWNDAERERLGDRVMRILDRHLPGTSSNVVAGVVLAPPDIEERYGVTGGHIHHGEQALDQVLIRPTPECLSHATPVEGLYLCSGGTHPGGGLTCAPGGQVLQSDISKVLRNRLTVE